MTSPKAVLNNNAYFTNQSNDSFFFMESCRSELCSILILLILVAIYTFVRKDFGVIHQRLSDPSRELRLAILIGALIGWNMPEERVKEYEEGVKNGGILMGVHARSDEDAAYLENEWRQNRGENVYR